MSLDWEPGIALIMKAYDERFEERAWQRWLAIMPGMTKETFVPFSEFKAQLRGTPVSARSREEILAEVAQIRQQIGR